LHHPDVQVAEALEHAEVRHWWDVVDGQDHRQHQALGQAVCAEDRRLEHVGPAGGELRTNLGRILSTLRGDGKYDGRIVVVNYYALNYTSLLATASSLMNG
jgi:hypothetical protein